MGRNKKSMHPVGLITIISKMHSHNKYKIVDGIKYRNYTKALIYGKIGLYKNIQPIEDYVFDCLVIHGYIQVESTESNFKTFKLTKLAKKIMK